MMLIYSSNVYHSTPLKLIFVRSRCYSCYTVRLPAAALALLLANSAASAETIAGRATVIDGDTLELHDERIRILDVRSRFDLL